MHSFTVIESGRVLCVFNLPRNQAAKQTLECTMERRAEYLAADNVLLIDTLNQESRKRIKQRGLCVVLRCFAYTPF